jgi:hypothetical protein
MGVGIGIIAAVRIYFTVFLELIDYKCNYKASITFVIYCEVDCGYN